jgi:hypothetical protein
MYEIAYKRLWRHQREKNIYLGFYFILNILCIINKHAFTNFWDSPVPKTKKLPNTLMQCLSNLQPSRWLPCAQRNTYVKISLKSTCLSGFNTLEGKTNDWLWYTKFYQNIFNSFRDVNRPSDVLARIPSIRYNCCNGRRGSVAVKSNSLGLDRPGFEPVGRKIFRTHPNGSRGPWSSCRGSLSRA